MKLKSSSDVNSASYKIAQQAKNFFNEKTSLCQLFEQVKASAELHNIFTMESEKAEFCQADSGSILCPELFSDLFITSLTH